MGTLVDGWCVNFFLSWWVRMRDRWRIQAWSINSRGWIPRAIDRTRMVCVSTPEIEITRAIERTHILCVSTWEIKIRSVIKYAWCYRTCLYYQNYSYFSCPIEHAWCINNKDQNNRDNRTGTLETKLTCESNTHAVSTLVIKTTSAIEHAWWDGDCK